MAGGAGVPPCHGKVDLMTQPSGWYDDPQDPSQLRYWDGVAWSGNTSPKVSPQVAQSTIGMPHGVTPTSARPQGTQDSPTTPGGYASPQQGQQDLGRQGGQWPPYGQDPGQYGQQGWTSNLATTPDGVPLSGWWRRVLARIIDSVVVALLALPLTFSPFLEVLRFMRDFFNKAMAAAEAGTATPVMDTSDIDGPLLQISLVLLAVSVVYEIAFLTRKGATPGKMAAGISVRLRERPGPPPMVPVLKRTAVKEGVGILGSVPFLGFFASLFGLLDVLWPLWDPKKQAIHDKVGATNVVIGPQPKRNA
jgi:uncharacterized RDD family membrane protein YckC